MMLYVFGAVLDCDLHSQLHNAFQKTLAAVGWADGIRSKADAYANRRGGRRPARRRHPRVEMSVATSASADVGDVADLTLCERVLAHWEPPYGDGPCESCYGSWRCPHCAGGVTEHGVDATEKGCGQAVENHGQAGGDDDAERDAEERGRARYGDNGADDVKVGECDYDGAESYATWDSYE